MKEGYLFRSESERGIIYCGTEERLLGEIQTLLAAYEENGEDLTEALSTMEIAPLNYDVGIFGPASQVVTITRYGDQGWDVELCDEEETS